MSATTIDTTTPAFAARLAAVLRTTRRDREVGLWALARTSGGAFGARQLRAIEAGEFNLASVDLTQLATLYGVDLSAMIQERVPLTVDAQAGVIATGGVRRTFVPGAPDTLLVAYLKMVRELRDLPHAPTIALRREDIETIAPQIGYDGAAVLDRLGELMGVTVAQRRSMTAAFAAGAALILLSTGAIAVESGTFTPTADDTARDAVVASAPADEGPSTHVDGAATGGSTTAVAETAASSVDIDSTGTPPGNPDGDATPGSGSAGPGTASGGSGVDGPAAVQDGDGTGSGGSSSTTPGKQAAGHGGDSGKGAGDQGDDGDGDEPEPDGDEPEPDTDDPDTDDPDNGPEPDGDDGDEPEPDTDDPNDGPDGDDPDDEPDSDDTDDPGDDDEDDDDDASGGGKKPKKGPQGHGIGLETAPGQNP